MLHRETDITSISPVLAGISPILAGQIEELTLIGVSINSGCVEVLIQSLRSPHSRLKLNLCECTISSSDYSHLLKAIPTEIVKIPFTTTILGTNVSSDNGTLEEAVVRFPMDDQEAQILYEAIHCSVKKLRIRHVLDRSFLYWSERMR